MSKERTDFTQGSILKKLFWFMVPILGALILQAAYGAVDLLVVGRFGSTSGLSAVSTGSQVLNLVTFVVTQLAMGITVLIARYLGEKRPQQIASVLGGAAVVFALISVGLCILLACFSRPISVLMQAPEESLNLTVSYVRICGSGIFFIVAYNLLSAIFRGLGDSKSPLLFVLVACVVNILGDLLLVAGFHMDAAGAALATVFAQAVSVVCAVVILAKKKLPFSLTRKEFRFNPQCGKFLKIGLPLALQEFLTQVSLCLCQPTWSGSFFRVWRSQQDCQFCHAGSQRLDAVYGLLCFPECGGWKTETGKAVHVYGDWRGAWVWLSGICPCYDEGRCARRLLYLRCLRGAEGG